MPKIPACMTQFWLEETDHPITGLDFKSLYPSIIMSRNFSRESIICSEEEARLELEKGTKLNEISFPYVDTHIRGWSMAHENDINKYAIFPVVLKMLFDTRQHVKLELKKYSKELESLRANKAPGSATRIDELEFLITCLNSKQLSLKIVANTAYGECGNTKSPLYLLQMAGGVTSFGRQTLKNAIGKVESMEGRVFYGDSDSCYISPAARHFATFDNQYFGGQLAKIDYCRAVVEIAFIEMKKIQNEVNSFFASKYGNDILQMDYEEVGYFFVLLSKKKYFCVPHVSIVNPTCWQPCAADHESVAARRKQLFIRGVDILKRGVSEFARRIVSQVMVQSMTIDNIRTIKELVDGMIKQIYTTEHPLETFVATDCYRPNKKNVKVLRFVERMRVRGITIKPNSRYEYVVVNKYPYSYDSRGRKVDLKIGDFVELYEVAVREKMQINLDYYMKGSVNGMLARLLSYHPTLRVIPDSVKGGGEATKEENDAANKATIEYAKRYVAGLCAQYTKTPASKGRLYQGVYKKAVKVVNSQLDKFNIPTNVLKVINSDWDSHSFGVKLCEQAEKQAIKNCAGYGVLYLQYIKEKRKADDRRIVDMTNIYVAGKYNLAECAKLRAERMIIKMQDRIQKCLIKCNKFMEAHSSVHTNICEIIKTALNLDGRFDDAVEKIPAYKIVENEALNAKRLDESALDKTAEDGIAQLMEDQEIRAALVEMHLLYMEIYSIYVYRERRIRVAEYLKEQRAVRQKLTAITARPADVRQDVAAMNAAIQTGGGGGSLIWSSY